MEQITRIGMDTSKSVFQLHGVNAAEQPVLVKPDPGRARHAAPPPEAVAQGDDQVLREIATDGDRD